MLARVFQESTPPTTHNGLIINGQNGVIPRFTYGTQQTYRWTFTMTLMGRCNTSLALREHFLERRVWSRVEILYNIMFEIQYKIHYANTTSRVVLQPITF